MLERLKSLSLKPWEPDINSQLTRLRTLSTRHICRTGNQGPNEIF